MRRSRKPSMTICPAYVPVSVESWPLASRATANSALPSAVPSSGDSKACACSISVTMMLCLKNTAAASTRIAAFTINAPFRAMRDLQNPNGAAYRGVS